MRWQELEGKVFITDIAMELPVQIDGGESVVGRYAVWMPMGQKHGIVETGSDLETLRKKYHVPGDMLLTVCRNGGSNDGV